MPNNKFSQISLFDIYEDVNTSFTEKKSELISLLEKHIDFSSLISYGFRHTFYSTFGRKHKYHLVSFIKALVIQKLFAFSYDSQLILVLKCSDELRNFCGFDSVPSIPCGSTRICTCETPCTASSYLYISRQEFQNVSGDSPKYGTLG